MTLPLRWAEAALNCWMNWPGFTPCWPSAGPIGGAGVAVPPGAWSLNWTVISFFAMGGPSLCLTDCVRTRGLPAAATNRIPLRLHDRRLDALPRRAVVHVLDDRNPVSLLRP